MEKIATYPNPDLVANETQRPSWNQPAKRRSGFHNLHRLARYGHRFRAARIMHLEPQFDLDIALRKDVQQLTSLPCFSGMIVIRGQHILYENYAPDFGRDRAHAIMSISKMSMNLVIGQLVESGKIDLGAPVEQYLPWIGPGYAEASVQDVLNMNVCNDYSEDYSDPTCGCFKQDSSTGYRLPADGEQEGTLKSFIASIGLAPGRRDTRNRTGLCDYKSANTDVLALIAEAVSRRPIASFMADLADAAGFEGNLDIVADREGFSMTNGGFSLTLRDLARYGALFVRRGRGVDGESFGSASFIGKTLSSGIPFGAPDERLRYSNMAYTDGRWLGHGGYGGQFLLADLESGIVGAYLSVLEDRDGYVEELYTRVTEMMEGIATGKVEGYLPPNQPASTLEALRQ